MLVHVCFEADVRVGLDVHRTYEGESLRRRKDQRAGGSEGRYPNTCDQKTRVEGASEKPLRSLGAKVDHKRHPSAALHHWLGEAHGKCGLYVALVADPEGPPTAGNLSGTFTAAVPIIPIWHVKNAP